MIKQSIDAIKENELIFLSELFAFVPFSKATFYNQKLDESDNIKKAIEDNRTNKKKDLRKLWAVSKQPMLQIALYKLLASDNELGILTSSKVEHSGSEPILIELVDAKKDTSS